MYFWRMGSEVRTCNGIKKKCQKEYSHRTAKVDVPLTALEVGPLGSI